MCLRNVSIMLHGTNSIRSKVMIEYNLFMIVTLLNYTLVFAGNSIDTESNTIYRKNFPQFNCMIDQEIARRFIRVKWYWRQCNKNWHAVEISRENGERKKHTYMAYISVFIKKNKYK